jgi:hypothetical protein
VVKIQVDGGARLLAGYNVVGWLGGDAKSASNPNGFVVEIDSETQTLNAITEDWGVNHARVFHDPKTGPLFSLPIF